MSFPLVAAHVVFVLIARPWADLRQHDRSYEVLPRALLGGSAEDLPTAVKTPDDGKLWKVLVCLKLADVQIQQYPKVLHPLSSYDDVAPSSSAFHGVADDREMILKSADRSAQRSGTTAADGHIPVRKHRIDDNRVLH